MRSDVKLQVTCMQSSLYRHHAYKQYRKILTQVKGKVVTPPPPPRRHKDGIHSFLTSELDGREWLASRSGTFNPRKEARCPLNRRLGGPRAGLGVLEKGKVKIKHGGNHVYHLPQLQTDSSLLNHSLCMFYLTVNTNRVYLGKDRALTDSYTK